MKMLRSPYLALAAVPMLAACGAADSNAVLDTVRMTEQAQIDAIKAKDLRGATRVYEDTASLVMGSGAPIEGIGTITGEFQKLLADPNMKVDFRQGPGWASVAGDLAVTTGTASLTTTDAATGKPVTT